METNLSLIKKLLQENTMLLKCKSIPASTFVRIKANHKAIMDYQDRLNDEEKHELMEILKDYPIEAYQERINQLK